MNTYIKEAQLFDVHDIMHLWNKNLSVLYRPFKGKIEREIFNYLVMKNEDADLIGFVTFSIKKRLGEFRIEHLCVDEPYRMCGYGTQLINMVTRIYNLNNYKVTTDCVKGAPNNDFWLEKGKVIKEWVLPSGLTMLRLELY